MSVIRQNNQRQIASEINKKLLLLGSGASERVMTNRKSKKENEPINLKSVSWESFGENERRRKENFEESDQQFITLSNYKYCASGNLYLNISLG